MDDVLQLAGALDIDLQGVVQEKDEYCKEVDKWDQVEEVDEEAEMTMKKRRSRKRPEFP